MVMWRGRTRYLFVRFGCATGWDQCPNQRPVTVIPVKWLRQLTAAGISEPVAVHSTLCFDVDDFDDYAVPLPG